MFSVLLIIEWSHSIFLLEKPDTSAGFFSRSLDIYEGESLLKKLVQSVLTHVEHQPHLLELS